MIIFKLIFFQALLLIINTQTTIFPISNCLSNCQGCSIKNPTACTNQTRQDTGKQGRCVPYYDEPNCTPGESYYNIYTQNGILNNFVNWSAPNQPALQQCTINNSSSIVSGIGPFNSTNSATKTLQFSPKQGIRKLLIKLGVAISDSRITQSNSNASQQVIQTEQNGTIYITTIDTTNNGSLTNIFIPFLNFKIYDLMNKGAVVLSTVLGYQNASLVLSKCGYIYQFQINVPATQGVLQQLSLELSLPSSGNNTLWWLMDFRVQAGCSGFSVGSACESCLTGFYPSLTQQGYASGCKHCNYACSSCTQSTSCLTCQKYATLNSSSRSCYYPSTYKIYNDSSYINTIFGISLKTNSSTFKQIYKSQNKILNLTLQLINNQSYLIKFYLLYPVSYSQNIVNFNFIIGNGVYQTSNLDFNKATLSDANNGTAQLYVMPYVVDRMGMNQIVANQTFFSQLTSPTPTQQFYIADITIVQYQCSKNCFNCSFSLSQTTSCQQCLPFYRIDTNCIVCANGFFQAKYQTQNRCVKCYATCKQCMGLSNLQCLQCYNNFELSDYEFNQPCIQKIINRHSSDSRYLPSIGNCPNLPTMTQILSKPNCVVCLSLKDGYYQNPTCISCWLSHNFASGRCTPTQSSGLTFYASDIVLNNSNTSWTSSGLGQQGCTADYPGLVGVPNIPNNLNKLTAAPTTLSYSLNSLPKHYGMTFYVNIYKVDYWAPDSNNKSAQLNITVNIDSPNSATSQFVLQLTNSIGANICGQQSNDMIWAFQANIPDHSSSSATVRVVSPDKGIFVRQLTVYLGNCPDCSLISLSYALSLLPVYSDNQTQTGLDVFVTFNKPVSFVPGMSQNPVDTFGNSFKFTVGNEQIRDIVLKENKINNSNYNSLKYFLPLRKSYINTTVQASTSQASMIYTQDSVATRLLAQSSQIVRLERYVDASADTRNSISQFSSFFNFFSWFALIIMIVTVGLGVGVVFEQFSLMMQLIFYHIYITSWLLPPTLKISLSNLRRMQHLNYFADITTIQKNLFGLQPLIPSNYIFTQFNIDIYFLRSIYPLIIINAIFIGWFLILKALKHFVYAFGHSPNKVARFFRSITDRPLAYFDQIFRYQFLAVMWACIIQFTNFVGDGSKKLNLAICVIAFIIAFAWPFAVTIYTAFFTGVKYIKHSIYLYHDIYYLKISSVGDQPKFYLYTLVKTGRLLAYAIFIGLFVNQSIIGPVLLIFVNLVDGAISYFLDIYRTGAYLLTRLIQNILLIIAAILFLVLFRFSDSDQFNQTTYEDLGFGLSTVFVLMIANGIFRFIYLAYKKIEEWSLGNYDVGQKGEKQNFDERPPIKVPQSQRF